MNRHIAKNIGCGFLFQNVNEGIESEFHAKRLTWGVINALREANFQLEVYRKNYYKPRLIEEFKRLNE